MADLALADRRALESNFFYRAMTDDSNNPIDTAPKTDELSPTTEATPETAAARKKKSRAAAKAAAAEIETRIGHSFKDPLLLATAFTHVSALKSQRSRTESYQRLEFLGDHVLGLVVSDMLFRAFPNADEGELSKRLADLVRKEACADVARLLGLLEGIKLGTVGAGAGQRLRKSVLGDICEAVIGAIFLDGGYPAAESFVQRNWTERMRKPVRPLRDPKTVLQEWAQGRGLPTPAYREVERSGPHHDPHFRIEVDVKGFAPAEGEGGSKRAAEKAAAQAMIAREGVSSGGNEG
ncbi:ribonuclease III [Tardiphaga sp. 839_C3_N1_4]|uniref:ribonuclease III n=1 Tax=Tardiphaga sp. 839_C3_N1_4 TaxID=3240761 RepID=UPI003F1F8AA5